MASAIRARAGRVRAPNIGTANKKADMRIITQRYWANQADICWSLKLNIVLLGDEQPINAHVSLTN
ncbi:hypothetical protein MAH1_23670 [Sessilibacter sp. MAH1]